MKVLTDKQKEEYNNIKNDDDKLLYLAKIVGLDRELKLARELCNINPLYKDIVNDIKDKINNNINFTLLRDNKIYNDELLNDVYIFNESIKDKLIEVQNKRIEATNLMGEYYGISNNLNGEIIKEKYKLEEKYKGKLFYEEGEKFIENLKIEYGEGIGMHIRIVSVDKIKHYGKRGIDI